MQARYWGVGGGAPNNPQNNETIVTVQEAVVLQGFGCSLGPMLLHVALSQNKRMWHTQNNFPKPLPSLWLVVVAAAELVPAVIATMVVAVVVERLVKTGE